jgi:hypothetical protein
MRLDEIEALTKDLTQEKKTLIKRKADIEADNFNQLGIPFQHLLN